MAFIFESVASPLHAPEATARLLAELCPRLLAQGGLPGERLAGHPQIFLVLTGGVEASILERTQLDRPCLLLCHPGHNSLPAGLETLARLHQLGARAKLVFLGDGGEGDDELGQAVLDLSVEASLRRLRLGRVGAPSSWLVASSPTPEVVRAVYGPTLIDISPDEVVGALPRQTSVTGFWPLSGVSLEALGEALSIVEALNAVVRVHALDAVTVRCFDLLTTVGSTGCLALAELADRGIPAGCEGDVPSTLGLILAKLRLGQVAWMANPARIQRVSQELWLAHCTAPRSLLAKLALDSHFESGQGVAVRGELPAGPVTLLRVGGVDLRSLWLAEGEVVGCPGREDLCRTQAQVRLSADALSALLERPLGNHLVLIPGHHAATLTAYHRWLIA